LGGILGLGALMEKTEQIAQIKTLMARLDSDVNVDAGGFRYNPTSVYVDPELAEKERKTFFQGHPQLVGLSGDLPTSNSFLTVNDLKTPILATRDSDGNFRAFVNSCSHRGVVLEEEERGETRRFTCQFHRWTYSTEGALVGVPKSEHFGDLDINCFGLIELPSEERHGLLWVHPDPEGVINLKEQLGEDLDAELASWNLGELQYLGQDTYAVDCNWKFAMDTFGETYHFSALHSETLNLQFHGNVQCYDTYGRNHRMLLCKRDIDGMRGQPESEWDITTAALPVYWLFPNVQLMPAAGVLFLVRAYPDKENPGKHVSQIHFYVRSDIFENNEIKELIGVASQNFAEIIRDEDYLMSASQQRSAESGAIKHSIFGRNEPALHHYHNTYRKMLDMELLPLVEISDTLRQF